MVGRMGIAILILTHANPVVFERLVRSLDHPDIAVFCHVDLKSDQAQFEAASRGKVTFVRERIDIGWGAYSMIEAELALFRAARTAGPFRAYALISGDSLPLLHSDALVDILGSGAHFLQSHEQLPSDKLYPRFERIYLPDTTIGQFRNKGYLERYFDPADLKLIERAIRIRETGFHTTLRFFKASQWFSVADHDLAAMLHYLQRIPAFEETFRFTAMSDESFFPTLMRVASPSTRRAHFFMGVDWTKPQRPYTLTTAEDYQGVYESEAIFYRKFSDKGLPLVDKVLANRLSLGQLASGEHRLSKLAGGQPKAGGRERAARKAV